MTEPAEEAEKPPRRRWVVMGLWSLCTVSAYSISNTIGILLPAITAEFTLSPGQKGLLGSAAFWGGLALAVPLGWWTLRFRPTTLTTVTMILGTLLLFLQGWSPGFVALLIGRVAFGITPIAREPARAFLIRQWFPQREIVMANGIFNLLFGVIVGAGLLITPIIVGGLGDDWRRPIYIFGGYFGVLTLLWMALGRERHVPEEQRVQEEAPREANVLRRTLSYPDLWVAGFGFLGTNTAWSAFVSFYPTLMLDKYGLSLQLSGGILAIMIITGGVAGVAVGYAVMSGGRRRMILQALGLLMAGSYAGMALSGSVPLLVIFAFLNGVAWGFWPILHSVPFYLRGIRSRETAMAMSFLMVMISGGVVIGPLLVGYLQEFLSSLQTGLLIAGFAPLSLVVAGLALRPSAEEAPQAVPET